MAYGASVAVAEDTLTLPDMQRNSPVRTKILG